MKIGYARVSTEEQSLEQQVIALQAAGCQEIYQEKESGGKDDRPEFIKMMGRLTAGDVVTVYKLDRLGRSMLHLAGVAEELRRREIGFASLTESIDTTTAMGRLVYNLLSSFADFERSLIRERTRTSLAHLKAKGVKLGRPYRDRTEEIASLAALIGEGKTQEEICTALRWARARYFTVLKAGNLKSNRAHTPRAKRPDDGRFTVEMVPGRKAGKAWPEGKTPEWAKQSA